MSRLTSTKPKWPFDGFDVVLSLRRAPVNKLYRVMFHDGLKPIYRDVVTHSAREARKLSEPTVPAALYGPNVVFVRATVSKNLMLTLDEDCIRLLEEKTGISL